MKAYFLSFCLIALVAIPCFGQNNLTNTLNMPAFSISGGSSLNGSGGVQATMKPIRFNEHWNMLLDLTLIDQGDMFFCTGLAFNTRLDETEIEFGARFGGYREDMESPTYIATGLSFAVKGKLSDTRKVNADLDIRSAGNLFWYRGQATADIVSSKGNDTQYILGAGVVAMKNFMIGPKLQFDFTVNNIGGGFWTGYGYNEAAKENLMAFEFFWKIPF